MGNVVSTILDPFTGATGPTGATGATGATGPAGAGLQDVLMLGGM